MFVRVSRFETFRDVVAALSRVIQSLIVQLTARVDRLDRNVVKIANAAAEIERRQYSLDGIVSDEMDNLHRTIDRVAVLEKKLEKVAAIEDVHAIKYPNAPMCDAPLCPPECAACNPEIEPSLSEFPRIVVRIDGDVVLSASVALLSNIQKLSRTPALDARGVTLVVIDE